MEWLLEGEGIHATVTIILKYDEANDCKTILKDAKGKYEWFHAVTDVHLDTGETGWIEPQTGEEIDLDFDGDGHVNTVPRGDITKGPSEGCYSVETFESWEDAKKTYGWK